MPSLAYSTWQPEPTKILPWHQNIHLHPPLRPRTCRVSQTRRSLRRHPVMPSEPGHYPAFLGLLGGTRLMSAN